MTKLLTQFAKLFILIVLGVSLSSPALAQEEETPSISKLFEKLYYRGFKDVQSFGYINVVLGNTAKQIGLSQGELTDYVKLRFKNNFAKIKYKEVPFEKWGDLNEADALKVGYLWFRVWVVGDDYPIAFHVQCRAGNITPIDLHIKPLMITTHGIRRTNPHLTRIRSRFVGVFGRLKTITMRQPQ